MLKNIWNKCKEYVYICLVYYMLPVILISDTASAMMALLLVTPMTVWIMSIRYGKKWGLKWYFSIIVALLWLPSIPIFYNSSAIIYAFIYGGLSFLGLWTGNLLEKNRSF